MNAKEPMTENGYQKLTDELNDLQLVQRPAILIAVEEARQLGDLKENAEYHSAKEKQKLIDIRIAELNDLISRASIIDPSVLPHTKVSFGSTVCLVDIETDEEIEYTIVGGVESDLDRNLISFNSPLAKELLSKEEGDEVKARLPGGIKEFDIEKIYYKKWY
jgi:transcription elongation factor GreA